MTPDQIQPDFAPLAYRHRQYGWQATVIAYHAAQGTVVIHSPGEGRSCLPAARFWAEYVHRAIYDAARRTA